MRNRTFGYLLKDKAIPSPAGEAMKMEYTALFEGNNIKLVETGVLDLQEYINSYADGVSLDKMIQRFKRGDTTAFERKQGFYADVSGMPNNLMDAINFGREAQTILSQNEPAAQTERAAQTDPAAQTERAAQTDPAVE